MSSSTIKIFPNSPTKVSSFFSARKSYSISSPLNSPASLEIEISCENGIITEVAVSAECSIEIKASNETFFSKTFSLAEGLISKDLSSFHSDSKTLVFEVLSGENIAIDFSILEFDSAITQEIPAQKVILDSSTLTKRLASSSNLQQAAEVLDQLISTPSLSLSLSENLTVSELSPKLLYLSPEVSSKSILVSSSWNGIIFNASDGSISLQIEAEATGEILCELSYSSNIKAAFFFYDSIEEEFVVVQTAKYVHTYQPLQIAASQIQLDTANFDKNLTSAEFNLQVALEKLDEALSASSLNFQSNSETLLENKQLLAQDAYFQLLDPGLSPKIVILSIDWKGQIVNIGDGSIPILLESPITNSIIAELSLQTGLKGALVWYDQNLNEFIIQQTSVWQRESAQENPATLSLSNTQKSALKLALSKNISIMP